MRISDEVYNKLREEGCYENHSHLLLLDLPSKQQIDSILRGLDRLGKRDLVKENSIFVSANPYRDIQVGTTFDSLFPVDKPFDFEGVEASVRFVYVNPSRLTDTLYKGHRGICLLEFAKQKPEVLRRLKKHNEKRVKGIHDMFYLSQRPVLSRILELIEEEKSKDA
ncbi:hypothetical protein AB9P05_04855 [Roseivirga sp. BDSF3-8]|uniref:hypothetical protein n=1 Tax=Roseivirga sp. BDSF3-8 TaxID=3241598 RepID=UPI003531A202